MMLEIVTDILTWSWFSDPHGYNFNGHLICHPDGNICIDPVEPTDEDLDVIVKTGVSTIILTNRNHSRAANQVQERTGAKTLIHVDDREHAEAQGTKIDGELSIGSGIGPLEIVDAAGKSPGEVALHWKERSILIVGDAVIGNPPGHCMFLPERVMDDATLIKNNVRNLLNLDFDILLVGDGAPILQDAKAQLKELAETFPQ